SGVAVVDGVVDGPTLAVRAAQLPARPVVALQHEAALACTDQEQDLRHPVHLRGSSVCVTLFNAKTALGTRSHRLLRQDVGQAHEPDELDERRGRMPEADEAAAPSRGELEP